MVVYISTQLIQQPATHTQKEDTIDQVITTEEKMEVLRRAVNRAEDESIVPAEISKLTAKYYKEFMALIKGS